MKFQKLTALFLSTALTVGLLAGCSSGGSGSTSAAVSFMLISV